MTVDAAVARTPLYDVHVGLGAKMSPFGGFLMPISYSGIIEEHDAVRSAVGMFDLSHMGQFVVRGDHAAPWLDSLTCNDVGTMKPNQARYNVFTNDVGGAMDDAIIYRLEGRWLVVVNASNAPKMWASLSKSVPAGVEIEDRTPRSALIALQGPRSFELLQPLTAVDLSGVKYYYAAEGAVDGMPAEIARTGYTGEDGFELFIDAGSAETLWQRLMAEAGRVGMIPAGLGARDVLRLEAGMPLYGHELEEDISPLSAGLDWVVKLGKAFRGRDALAAQAADGRYPRIAGIVMDGKAPARAGYPVYLGDTRVGDVRSGSPAPSLGGKNIGTVLVDSGASAPKTALQIEIRGQRHGACVVSLPFYKRKK
ncbi:MAG TPA: glycine cleavage system aminomethyltransferase GcvT [Candidatus Eremiobacteraceae bacterium]|nr:glycine cleavage system aminomethyltransferase GcvT [Candidatus Eremiobacteraceae bacterium]